MKASAKHSKSLAKLLLEAQDHSPAVLSSVMLGEDTGMDTFEMRHYAKELFGENDIKALDGFMLYGTDVLHAP